MATKEKHILEMVVSGAINSAQKVGKLKDQIKNLDRANKQLKAGMLGMRGLMIGTAGSMVALGLGIRRTITAYADYTQAQSRLRTTLAAVTESYRENARISSTVAERAAINLGYSTTEANDAMTTMIQTGIGVHASMRLIGTSLRLARIGEMETSNATRFLVDTMNMFRGEMARDNITMRQFAERMTGQLAVAANMSSTNIQNLQQAFRYAGTELSALGYESNEVMSALAGLSVVGLRSTTSGTRLRGAIAALVDPAGNVREQITQLTGDTRAWVNIVHDQEGNLRRLPDMMAQLMAITARTTSTQERNNLMFSIFGRRSFAAGASMATYNRAAQVMLEINREISDDDKLRERQMRMEEERMRSFGMEVDQLKHGLTDLAIAFGEILFGEMEGGREGFGTYVRELVRAVRVIGMLEDGHEDMQREFSSIDPVVRSNAAQLREFLRNVVSLIKFLAEIAKKFAWFATNFPTLTVSLIALRIAFGGFIPVIRTLGPSLLRAITLFRQFPPSIALTRGQLQGFNLLAGSIGVAAVGALTESVVNMTLEYMNAGKEMETIRGTTVAAHRNWAAGIPIIGDLAAQYVDLAGAIQRAWSMYQSVKARRENFAQERTLATTEERLQARYARMSSIENTEQRMGQTISLERSASVQRLAQLLFARGRTSREGIRRTLETGGLEGERLEQTVRQIQGAIRNYGEVERQNARVIAGNRSLEDASLAATRQLGGFETAIENFSQWVESNAMGVESPASDVIPTAGEESIETAQDAYVNRGGVMGVSSGDIIVSRRHLANAVLARQGAMAGPAVAMAGEGMMVGPSPTVPGGGGGGGGSMSISIPVMLDGREIARAVGRANVTQLERGGGRLPPGQRRSLRETGFSRVV